MSNVGLSVLLAIVGLGCSSEIPATGEVLVASNEDPQIQSPGNAEDWPNFLGPHHNGTSLETGLSKEWPEDGPPVLWKRSIGEGYGAPVVAKGKLLMFHRVGNEEVIDCVDAKDGSRTIWTHKYPTQYDDDFGYNGGPRSSPAIDGDRVYTFGAEGVLTCVEFETGERVWQRPVNKEYNVKKGFFGVGTAPVIEENLVLINVGGWNGAGVVAFDKNTGEEVWKASNDAASYSTPIVRTVNDERLAIFHTADGLLVLEAKTGAVRHQYPFRSATHNSAIAATPVLVDDVIFLSATYNIGAVALRLDPGGLTEVWKRQDSMQTHWATAIYHEGYLYGMSGRHEQGSNLRCIEFSTGKVMWTAEKGLGRASFIMADGHLIAIGERGDLALIEVSPDGYVEKARARIMKGPTWTPPVLSHGLLYVRNDPRLDPERNRQLICLDLRAAK
jgi:outer membrane protein assembly factor BamB